MLAGRGHHHHGFIVARDVAALAEHPGEIVVAACLIDRSGGKAEIGVKRVALATLDIPAYAPDALPPELEALPAVKPGSPRARRRGLIGRQSSKGARVGWGG